LIAMLLMSKHRTSLISRQAILINAAIHSQTEINEDNLRKGFATYPRLPKLRQRVDTEMDDHSGTNPFLHTHYETRTKVDDFLCHEMDSSTESVLG